METPAKKGHVLRFAGRKLGDMWTMRVKHMLVFMAILKLELISGLQCQYCWPRDGQREIASCDKRPSTCVQMMGLTFASNIREIRVYSCAVRILGINLKGMMVKTVEEWNGHVCQLFYSSS